MKKPPLVEVRWRDAFLRSSSATLEEAVQDDDYSLRFTAGWLVHDGDKKIILAMTFDPGEPGEQPSFDDRYTIPRPYVDTIRYLTRRPKAGKKEPTP